MPEGLNTYESVPILRVLKALELVMALPLRMKGHGFENLTPILDF